ncbi:hypothetical protein CEV33_4379 [Brucella grignonensis]|uniref:Uncharacterized protein n=1 Tax=Brucella grignonensis TaxID=94627 RepID=A0A256FNN2_9HYPH|nr:hypothetical protein CEV33_4379 [Brucella grignonensis]
MISRGEAQQNCSKIQEQYRLLRCDIEMQRPARRMLRGPSNGMLLYQ